MFNKKRKLMLFGFLPLVLLVLAASGYFYYGVKITADLERYCAQNSYIAVTVKNNSFKTVGGVHFSLYLFKNAVSVNKLASTRHRFNRLVEPFDEVTLCYRSDYTDEYFSTSENGVVSLSRAITDHREVTEFLESHEIYLKAPSIWYID